MFSPSGPVTLTTTASSSDEPLDQSLIRYGGWGEMTVSVLLRDVSLFQFPEETCVDDNDRELLAQCLLDINPHTIIYYQTFLSFILHQQL